MMLSLKLSPGINVQACVHQQSWCHIVMFYKLYDYDAGDSSNFRAPQHLLQFPDACHSWSASASTAVPEYHRISVCQLPACS